MLKAKSFVKYIVLIIAMASMACSERTYNNETLLIEWTDTNTGLIFRVTERPGVPGFASVRRDKPASCSE
jgi:hypothetical protein